MMHLRDTVSARLAAQDQIIERQMLALQKQAEAIADLHNRIAMLEAMVPQVAAAQAVLAAKDRHSPGRPPHGFVAATIAQVAEMTGISPKAIKGTARDRATCEARWRVMQALHKAGASQPFIGRVLNKDHTTVTYGLKRAQEMWGVG